MPYRIVFAVILFSVCVLTIYLAHAAQKGALPPTTGPYRVSFRKLDLAIQPTLIPIYLWYPTRSDNRFGHFASLEKFPIVLFAPGWGGRGDDSSALTAELASHGYIVIGFNDVGQDRADIEAYSDHLDLSRSFELSSENAEKQSLNLANARIQIAASKVQRILNALQKEMLPEPFSAGHPDFEKIGFMGFSFGGAVAAEMSHLDARIDAVVNMDGWLFAKAANQGVPRPYLAVASAEAFPPSSDLQSKDDSRRLSAEWCQRDEALHRSFLKRGDFYWYLADGARHEDFTNELFATGWLGNLTAKGKAANALHENLTALILSFFDNYLKQKPAMLLSVSPSGSPSPLRQLTATSRP